MDSENKNSDKKYSPFLNCQQAEELLETYWKTPEKLSRSKRFSIALHLLKCKKCAEKFVEIKENNSL